MTTHTHRVVSAEATVIAYARRVVSAEAIVMGRGAQTPCTLDSSDDMGVSRLEPAFNHQGKWGNLGGDKPAICP